MNSQIANNNNHLDVVAVLRTIQFFQDLRKIELREFAKIIYVRWFRKNEPIFYENEPGIGMYIIHKGSVKISKSSTLNGREHIITLTQGDFFGELSLIKEQPRAVTAIALEDCCLLGIFRPDLLQLLEKKPRLGNKILLRLNQFITTQLQQKDEELFQIKEKLASSNFIS